MYFCISLLFPDYLSFHISSCFCSCSYIFTTIHICALTIYYPLNNFLEQYLHVSCARLSISFLQLPRLSDLHQSRVCTSSTRKKAKPVRLFGSASVSLLQSLSDLKRSSVSCTEARFCPRYHSVTFYLTLLYVSQDISNFISTTSYFLTIYCPLLT